MGYKGGKHTDLINIRKMACTNVLHMVVNGYTKAHADLLSFEGYPVGLRIEEHSDVKVGVAEPLDCLIHVGHCTQSNLKRRGNKNKK